MLIGVTTVNGSGRVLGCIRSFTEVFPTSCAYQGIIVDDGSDESHARLLDEIGSLYDFKVIHHQRNLGIPAGWNTIAQHAAAQGHEHAVILNDDVFVLPQTLERAVEVFARNPRLATLGLVPVYQTESGLHRSWPDGVRWDAFYRCRHSFGCSFLLRVSVWEEIGGFDAQFRSHFEDVDFGIRAQEAGYVALNSPYPVLHGWARTFAENPHLHGHLWLEVSRRLFRRKHGKDPHEFGPYPEVTVETPEGPAVARFA